MTATITQTFDQWLHQTWPASFLALCGYSAHDKPFFHPLLPDNALLISEDSWQILNEALAQLAAHDCGEGQSRWVFETALLWIVRRPDGAWAGVLTPCKLPQSAITALDERLQEFLRLEG